MDEENLTNHRDEMLSRFRESIRRPISERYFDEDELLEIFDYAGDVNDEYLRTEALLCAARFYPDSEAFLERKAVYYAQISDDMRNRFLKDNETASGMIWDILRVRAKASNDADAALSALDEIIDKYDKYTDEETIQLIFLPSSLGAIEWIKSRLPKLRSKAGFLNILLYEVAVAADLNGDAALSVSMLEELTELEPFNPYYWMMLAKEYAVIDDKVKALSAIDYSLAINPEDPQALFIKARLLYVDDSNNERSQVITLLEKALTSKDANVDIARFLASVYSETGDNIKASDTLHGYLDAHPDEALSIVPDLVLYDPEDIDQLLDMFYQSNEENSQLMWISWSHQLMINGLDHLSKSVIDAYQRNSGVKIETMVTIERLFVDGRFDDTLVALGEYLENNDTVDSEFPMMVVIHLISMLRIGEIEKAESFCDFLENTTSIKNCRSLTKRIEFHGMIKIVREVKALMAENVDPSFWETYDPLKLW